MSEPWDAVVIGSGFGGSMAALQLARAGARVLMLERGRWVARDATDWDPHAILVARRYASATPVLINGSREPLYPDEVVGGGSVFYGAAAFRLRREDLNGEWPIRYEDLAPFYDEAERLLGVVGAAGHDPTEPPRSGPYVDAPPAYSAPARAVAQAARSLGLRPFPIPLAINFAADATRSPCQQCLTCDMFPCPIGAKNDLAVTVIRQIMDLGVEVRAGAVALRLVRRNGRIEAIQCVDAASGRIEDIHCRLCIVSGGAIGSAALLLRSDLQGVTPNGSLIGRYLMRHCNAIVAGVFPFTTNPERVFHKQVALTDFYFGGPATQGPAGPWGMIQGLQVAPPETIVANGPFPLNRVGALTTRYHIYLMCIAHEMPRAENRVVLASDRRDAFGQPLTWVMHQYAKRDLAARSALCRQAARVLRRAGAITRARVPVKTFSHAVGTCRFGPDPRTAVLDPWCRFFGLENLYVVDGSFMPSAGAVNPSLTIAANGLRVGQYLARSMGAS